MTSHTVTIVRPKQHACSVEKLDAAQERVSALINSWIGTAPLFQYTAAVQKTGRTRQVDGQTAEEYRVIGIALGGRRRVDGSSVYWIVAQPPSPELAAFQAHWSRECSLPFPGMQAGARARDRFVFGVMADAASALSGYPVQYVVETRPPIRHARFEITVNGTIPDPSILNIWMNEMTFGGFTTGPIDPSVFSVPAGYKERRSIQYRPD